MFALDNYLIFSFQYLKKIKQQYFSKKISSANLIDIVKGCTRDFVYRNSKLKIIIYF
jgi:hypothetical protein